MYIENLGFRCAQSLAMRKPKDTKPSPTPATKAPDAAKDVVTANVPPTTTRAPRRHKRSETWEYKVQKVLEEVVAGNLESADHVLHGLRDRRAPKDEL